MLEDNYDERLAKEVLDNWSTIRLSAFNSKSPTASSTWSAIEERIGAFSETTSALGRYRNLISGLNAVDKGNTVTFSFRPPWAEESYREIQRLNHEAKAEREVAELEFALALFERFRQNTRLSLTAHAEATAKELRELNAFVKHVNRCMQLVPKTLRIDPSKGHRFSRAQILYRHMSGASTNLLQCKTLPNDHLTGRFNGALQTVIVRPVVRRRGRGRKTIARLESLTRKSGTVIKLKKSPLTRAQRQAALDHDSDVEIVYNLKPSAVIPLTECDTKDAKINAEAKSIPQIQYPIEVKIEKREIPSEFSSNLPTDTLMNPTTDDDDDPFEQTLLLLDEADLLGACYPLVQEARGLLDKKPYDLEIKKLALQKFSMAFKALKNDIKETRNEEVADKRRRGLEMLRSLHIQYFAQVLPLVN